MNQIIGYNPQTGEPIYQQQSQNYQNNIGNSQFNQQIIYASFRKRLGAYLIDSIIMGVVGLIIYALLITINFFMSMQNSSSFIGIIMIICTLLIMWGQPIYCLFAECSKKHATLGKRIMHIVVKNNDGSYLTFPQSLIRNLLKLFIPGGTLISIITILFNQKKQALHDIILNQVVVNE
ncbi:MAG: RDD family protein [Bacilli bacterium]|nr:RDD family protein [Bacilli bacterium]